MDRLYHGINSIQNLEKEVMNLFPVYFQQMF